MVSDGSSAASQAWEGSPPTYWPVGLSVALFLVAGPSQAPLVFFSGLVAALVNYHRPLFSWCGIPGVFALYIGYLGAAILLRNRWRIDLRLASLRDTGRFLLVFLVAEVFTAVAGMLTLLGDGLIHRSDVARTIINWWASDAIALITFTPLLLIFVAPQIDSWLKSEPASPLLPAVSARFSRPEIFEIAAQCASVVLAIWLVFGFAPAIPYQPLYLLFVPVIWVAVRRGLPGAVLTVFAINVGLTLAAGLTQASHGSLPRLQLAMLALGSTGLCLGAVVSEGKRAEEQLRRSEAGLHEAQRVSRLGGWSFDPKSGNVTWTEELYRILGFDPSLPPPRFSEQEKIFTPESWQRLNVEFDKTLTTGIPYEIELETVHPDGDTGWILARGEPQRNPAGVINSMSGSVLDITERKRAEKQVQFLAYYDGLTGLPNRRLLQDRLVKAIASARRRSELVAVLFLDLDRFKIINDSLGHSVGDLLLQESAERLKRQVRDQDTVSRVGGDEFLVVLSSIPDIEAAAAAAERIVNAMSTEFTIQDRSLRVSCSVGISIFPEHGNDAEALIKNADAAMYGAKESGRNRFRFFSEAMNAQVVERSMLEQGLRMALDRNELFLMYQPQADLRTGKITGLEALLRWRHPELGLIPPDKFIRVAENSGLIVPIGEWVLRTACLQVRRWQQDGIPPLTIAVNVSAMQFRQEGFREFIHCVLRETGLAPQYLELELTESLLTSNADVMFAVMQDLKDMGLKLAIDDFGTGYSSLSYLRQFPVSKLKIDGSFIHDVATSADAAAIATAIISLAKSLNLKVIAEGVETEAQVAFLREHHCDEVQGYYLSQPLHADLVPDRLPALAGRTMSAASGH
jgi:diguanylate cyclase (GGDEF)-like protein/PAS domain S-box-containing protein